MIKIVCLIGKSGSGKDTLIKEIFKRTNKFNRIIPCTSRPPRNYEKDGEDFYFLDENFFHYNNMIEYEKFNNHFYGTLKSSLREDLVNIGIFNPSAIKQLLKVKNLDLKIYCLCADDKIRIIRQLNRENSPNIEEIFRRFLSDNKDFNLDFSYITLTNNNKEDLEKNTQIILDILS